MKLQVTVCSMDPTSPLPHVVVAVELRPDTPMASLHLLQQVGQAAADGVGALLRDLDAARAQNAQATKSVSFTQTRDLLHDENLRRFENAVAEARAAGLTVRDLEGALAVLAPERPSMGEQEAEELGRIFVRAAREALRAELAPRHAEAVLDLILQNLGEAASAAATAEGSPQVTPA